jgi:trimethylamine-N-oxide reductase cytochrome c-type subunit TorC
MRALSASVVIAVFCGAGALVPALGAGTQKYAAAITPLLDAAAGKTIGSVGPGTALTVVAQSGSSTHVTLQGVAAPGGFVYVSADKHIVELSGFAGKETSGAVTVDGWVATNALVDDVQALWKSTADLYAQKCGQCHALQPVNSYSANQWPAIMKTQADNAGLDPGQTALITAYLQVESGH